MFNAMGYADYGDEVVICPHCGGKCYDQQTYCHLCGKILHNCCVQEECEAYGLDLLPNAKYCPSCGEETTFSLNDCVEELVEEN